MAEASAVGSGSGAFQIVIEMKITGTTHGSSFLQSCPVLPDPLD